MPKPIQYDRKVTGRKNRARYVWTVADDGPGFPRRHREGTGLSNLRARLATLYNDAASLEIDRTGPGSRVVVRVPALASRDEILSAVTNGAAVEAAVVKAE